MSSEYFLSILSLMLSVCLEWLVLDLEVLLSARDFFVCEDLRSVLEFLSGSVDVESSPEYYLKVSCYFYFFLNVFVL